MKLKSLFIVIIISLMVFVPTIIWAGTTVTFTTDLTEFQTDQLIEGADKYQKFVDNFFNTNEKVFPTALVMANTLGYPNGKATIGTFPHFEFGVAAGGGVYQLSRYEDFSEENPTSPFAGANAGAHVGTGITDRLDVTFKFFSLGWFNVPEKEFSRDRNETFYELKINDFKLITTGVKARYNLIPGITIIPVLLSFGGINLNLGVDYMKGETNTELTIQDVEEIEIGAAGLEETVEAVATYTSIGQIEWSFLSVTPEMLVYMDFIYFLTIYTGPSVSINSGSLDVNLQGSGNVVATGELGSYATDDKLATIIVDSEYTMKPKRYIPKWTAGVEINLLALKIQAEVVSILSSPKDSVMGQLGVRFQF